jgi:SAM-dependent methyltransferase
MTTDFDQLIAAALANEFSGWDFSHITGRWREEKPSWDYRQRVTACLSQATALLDMGTGGGEFLAALSPLPPVTCASEGYPPNLPIAQARLEPLGVNVYPVGDDDRLPFADQSFDLVINRHESFDPAEVYRVLRPNGRFLTQQVGGRDNIQLNQWLQSEVKLSYETWNLAAAVQGLTPARFVIVTQQEEYPRTTFHDIGAVVYYLKAIPWQIEGFDVQRERNRLLALHRHICTAGPFITHSHRFYIEAVRRN